MMVMPTMWEVVKHSVINGLLYVLVLAMFAGVFWLAVDYSIPKTMEIEAAKAMAYQGRAQ